LTIASIVNLDRLITVARLSHWMITLYNTIVAQNVMEIL